VCTGRNASYRQKQNVSKCNSLTPLQSGDSLSLWHPNYQIDHSRVLRGHPEGAALVILSWTVEQLLSHCQRDQHQQNSIIAAVLSK